MAAPALSTSAIFVFMYTWNEFFLAGILTTKYAVTLSVGIMNFQQAHSVSWNLTTAASMIAVFPLILIIATLQKYVVSGLTAGGLKG
jgi:ABC-type glycerol-3-phosphate transport system permease component